MSGRNPAPTAPSASAPATAPISRSRSPPCRSVFPTTRKPARRCARRPKPRCSPIAIPARTSIRRCRSAASPIRRCRTRSASAGVQSILRLQGRRPDLVRRAEEHRRQGRRRAARRHHRHRGEREEDGTAADQADHNSRQERHGGCHGAAARQCRQHHGGRSCNARRQIDPHGRPDLHSGAVAASRFNPWV